MRPHVTEQQTELYECFSCGERVSEPETQLCTACGGELLNLGRSRDL
ncbi:rubrerythrin-like domain-containing protein [Halobacteriaceae bacterium SHR40]